MPELKSVFSQTDARDLILEGALRAFAERGFHGASMRDIAQRAGVSQSLVHHHFGSKEALWNFVGERISADFLEYTAEATDEPVNCRSVGNAFRTYMAYWRDHPAMFRFNLWRILEGPSEERKSRSKALNGKGVPLFAEAQKAGFLRTDIAPGLAMVIGGSLIQYWLHSQTEIQDALAVTSDKLPSDDEFLESILGLLEVRSSSKSQNRENT